MRTLAKAAILYGGVSVLAMTAGAITGIAQAQESQVTRNFNIPSKPLLSALADFTAATGIQVVRPNAERISGTSGAVVGQYSPEAALRGILAGSGLIYQFTGPRTVSVHRAGEPATTFAPVEGQIQLEPIYVQGDGSGAPLGGDFSQIDITSEDLERKNPTDVKQIFRGEPGVSVGSSIPMSQKVYVHGVEETNLAVTIDGSRQNNKVFHHNGTNLIDPGLLKAVRVDAGVAPADAGPGALAGAIIYETKDARDLLAADGFGGFVKSQFNTNGNVFTNNIAGYGMQNGFEFLGYGSFAKGDEFEAGNGQTVEGTETNFLSGLGKLAYEAETGDRFEISHERVRDDAIRPFRANAGTVDPGRYWKEPLTRPYKIDRENTVFSYSDTTPSDWWDPKIVLAYSATSVNLPSYGCLANCRPPDAPAIPVVVSYPTEGETESFNGKVENKFGLDFGSITAGMDFYRDRTELTANSTVLGFSDDSMEKASNIGAYAQARLEPWERTRLSFGMRADQQWFEGTGGQEFENAGVSGNVSGEYDLTEFLTAKAGYSHVWAGIPLAEAFIMNPNWIYGEDPEPVTADNINAGLIARYNGFIAEGGVFRTEIDDARLPAYRSDLGLRTRDLESEGFEIGLGYDWDVGFVRVKYAHIDVTIDGQPADSDTGTYIATPVGDIITIVGAYTFDSWDVTVGGDIEIAPEYDRVVAGSPPYPAYEVVNVFAEYRPEAYANLIFRAEVNNLFDETYSDRATYGSEFGNVTPLFEPGRSFVFSAKATF
jgi:hemoglobin/transferrin/lactoferrin receptor protein